MSVDIQCVKCHRNLDADEFPPKLRANPDGSKRNKQCYRCLGREKPEKENVNPLAPTAAVDGKRLKQRGSAPTSGPQELPIVDLEDFLAYLREQTGIIDIEARVRTANSVPAGDTARRSFADSVAAAIWRETDYRFKSQSSHESKDGTTTRFSYTCSQNAGRQAKSQKHADPAKQRDKISLDTFDCNGWLHITVSDGVGTVFVKLRHQEDHVHYESIDIPQDVLDLVANCGDQTVSQLWTQILTMYPCPNFTRKSIHNLWARKDQLKWKRHDDQLKSAEILLEEGKIKGGLGMYAVHPLDIKPEPGFEALAWALPDVLGQWGGRVREVALDSAWETNSRRFELYALLGEAYGSALPLGFLLLCSTGGGEPGGTQRCLERFIQHFAERLDNILFTHTDKNLPEINAFRAKVQNSKHQLCFWHALRAVKTRLSILRRQPAHYDAQAACSEFHWIDPTFVPLAQRSAGAPPPPVPAATVLPTISVRLAGKLVARPVPGFRIRIPPRGPPRRSARMRKGDNDNNDNTDSDKDNDSDGDEDEVGFEAQVDVLIADAEDDVDEEDGPDWLFEEGESRSSDHTYVFCPAQHRKQLLKLFTKHFVQHPLLPEQDWTGSRSADEIRYRAVEEMYNFCVARGLTEVWAYMWTCWYRSKMWRLWALSASPRVPRLRTTMVVENFWKQLKHDWLHHLLHPRLDQLVHIICTKVVPAYMQRAAALEDMYRRSRSRAHRPVQKAFKRDWLRLQKVPIKGSYSTDVALWQCNCGAQKYSAFLLCKHLVQAVPPPSPKFFLFVIRRRTTPFYCHPELRPIGAPLGAYRDADDGTISDGDDHVWLGDTSMLRGNGGWRELPTLGRELLLKRKRSAALSSTCSDGDVDGDGDGDGDVDGDGDASAVTYEASDFDGASEDVMADECHQVKERVRTRISDMRYVLSALEAHVDSPDSNSSGLWLRTMADCSELEGVSRLAQDLRHKDKAGRARQTTWGRGGTKRARRYAKNTMGFQQGLIEDSEDN